MLFIIGVFENWIMLGDCTIFSDRNLVIFLIHQIPTAIIHCVIAIHCCY